MLEINNNVERAYSWDNSTMINNNVGELAYSWDNSTMIILGTKIGDNLYLY